MSSLTPVIDLVKQKMQRKQLEWEYENKDEIKDTALYDLDPDLVVDAVSDTSNDALTKIIRMAMNKDYASIGLLLGPGIEAYLWTRAADEVQRKQEESDDIKLRDEELKQDTNEALTAAQRNPDLVG